MSQDNKVHPVFAWNIEVLANYEAAIFRFKAVPIGTVDPETMQPDDMPAMAFALDGMRRLRDELEALIRHFDAHSKPTGLQ